MKIFQHHFIVTLSNYCKSISTRTNSSLIEWTYDNISLIPAFYCSNTLVIVPPYFCPQLSWKLGRTVVGTALSPLIMPYLLYIPII